MNAETARYARLVCTPATLELVSYDNATLVCETRIVIGTEWEAINPEPSEMDEVDVTLQMGRKFLNFIARATGPNTITIMTMDEAAL